MLVLAIIALLLTLGWGYIVFVANEMSDAPSLGFQGGGSVLALAALTVVLFVLWSVGFHWTL